MGDLPFSTERLVLSDWHQALPDEDSLASFVTRLLEPETTRWLPPDWRGSFDADRARMWIEQLDGDPSTSVLAISDRRTSETLGLVLVWREDAGANIGYLLLRSAWGRGVATEALIGLVHWWADAGEIERIHAGVASGNAASARVLAKAGFVELPQRADGERLFVRTLKEAPSGST